MSIRTRQPPEASRRETAGSPTGGQFASVAHPEPEVTLGASPGLRAVSLAMDGGDLGMKLGALVTYKVEDGTHRVRFEKHGAAITVLISRDPADTHPYDVLFHTRDEGPPAGGHTTLFCTQAEVLDLVRAKLGG